MTVYVCVGMHDAHICIHFINTLSRDIQLLTNILRIIRLQLVLGSTKATLTTDICLRCTAFYSAPTPDSKNQLIYLCYIGISVYATQSVSLKVHREIYVTFPSPRVLFGNYFLNYVLKLFCRNRTYAVFVKTKYTELYSSSMTSEFILTLLGRLQAAKHSSTLNLEAP